jgi:hydroxyacylglutathione hydrolase
MLQIEQLAVLSDNYVYLLRDSATGTVGVVDPAEPEPVLAALARLGWPLHWILNTHHHPDHVGGNEALIDATACKVVGPSADAARIPGITLALGEGEEFALGESKARVFDVPGHTRGHIAFWFADAKALFCGDTLFALGCGRLFEGTPAQMWDSLSRLKALPGDTRVYCAHEYTQSNGRFALAMEPGNAALQARMRDVDARRAAGQPTVPSTLADEWATNPFLRPDSPELQATLALAGRDLVDVFGATRARKDTFRG